MDPQEPSQQNALPPPPPPPVPYKPVESGGLEPGSTGLVPPQQAASVDIHAGQWLPPPLPPGRPQPGGAARLPGSGNVGYSQQPGYRHPYPYAAGVAGFPMWAWGAIGAAVIVLLGGSALVIALALSGSNSAANGGGTPNLPGQFNTNIGPPDWVKPGAQITFYNAAASVAQSSYAWIEDPNCTSNCWKDPKTGKLYTRTDETPGASMGWASGDGLTEIDILAVEGKDIVFSMNTLGIDRSTNTPAFVPAFSSGGKTAGTVVDGAWIHPSLLVQLQDYNQGGLLILRGDYPLNGVTYKALGFASTGGAGSSQQYTYDMQTGLLLSATTNTKGATSPLAPQGGNPPQGNTQLTISRLAGNRQRSMPGADGINPSWLDNTKQLAYSGTYHLVNPVNPASMDITAPMVRDVTIGEHGRNWALYTVHSQIQMLNFPPEDVSGAGGPAGLYWMDPAALASMTPQQVLDTNALTGERTEVTAVGPGARGTAVTIVRRVTGVETTLTYDQATGVLLNYKQTVSRSGTTVDLALQRGP